MSVGARALERLALRLVGGLGRVGLEWLRLAFVCVARLGLPCSRWLWRALACS